MEPLEITSGSQVASFRVEGRQLRTETVVTREETSTETERENSVKKHTLTRPEGATATPASTLLEALRALLTGARMATRLRVYDEREHWLDEVCAIAVTSIAGGRVQLEAPAFGPNVRALVGQPVVAHLTVIDLFADVLSSALKGDRETLLADRALLEACVRFAHACPEVELVRSNGVALAIRPADASVLEHLRDVTPGNCAVRIAGDLKPETAIGMATLVVSNGDTVRVRLTGPTRFGQRTVVSGFGHFGPSGRCFLVDAEHVGGAEAGDEVFERVPVAHPADFVPASVPQDATSGVNAFFGIWPGDETDEELLAALKAIR